MLPANFFSRFGSHAEKGVHHAFILKMKLNFRDCKIMGCEAFSLVDICQPFEENHLQDRSLDKRGADKLFARPGRKQVTATKRGIYVTYSPRRSIHFLARCSNFCKPIKIKFRRLAVQPCLRGSNDLHVGRKMANFQFLLLVRGTGGRPTGPDTENRVGDQILEAQVGQFLLGCKCLVSRAIFVQEQDPFGEIPAAFFLKNFLQLHQRR